MNNPVIYVLLDSSLNMSAGKASAQAVHAVAQLHTHSGIDEFAEQTKRTVIILEAKDQQQLYNLETYLLQLDVPCASYIDEGVNEVTPYSLTALAVGPIEADNEEARSILAPFRLYGKSELRQLTDAMSTIHRNLNEDKHSKNVIKRLKKIRKYLEED